RGRRAPGAFPRVPGRRPVPTEPGISAAGSIPRPVCWSSRMYAVFRAGGKQYRAAEGERLKVEKIDAEEGADVSFDEVLLVGEGSDVKVGTPLLAGTSVTARVVRQGRTG